MKEKKREPWPIVVGIAAIAFIVYTWVEKDIAATYASLPQEQLLPMILTSAAVTLLKIVLIAGGILLIKWIVGKIRKELHAKSQRPRGLWLLLSPQ